MEQIATGAAVGATPAIAAWASDRLDVLWRDSNNRLLHAYKQGSAPWSAPTKPYPGIVLHSDPAVASWGPGRLDVFWRAEDDRLRRVWFAKGAWSTAMESLGEEPGSMRSAPSVSSWGLGRLDVFWAGPEPESHVRHVWLSGAYQPWSSEEVLPPTTLIGDGTSPVVATAAMPFQVHYAWKADASLLGHNWIDFEVTSAWQSESVAAGVEGAPALVGWPDGRLDVLWRQGGKLMHDVRVAGSWKGAESLGALPAGGVSAAPAAAFEGKPKLLHTVMLDGDAVVHKGFPVP